MNYNNFAQKTNWIAGSDKFKNVPFFLTSVNVPGMNFSHPEVGGRNSTRVFLQADTVTFNTLSFEMLIDEDFEIYQEMMTIIRNNINVESGTFGNFFFDFWIELNNSKGHKVMKLDFTNCRISSISDVFLDTQDESTEHKLIIEVDYDYYEIENNRSYILRN